MDSNVNQLARGRTWYAGETIDTANLTGTQLEGKAVVFKNADPSAPTALRDQQDVEGIIVRNMSGIALLPGMIVQWKSGYRGTRVDGYVRTTAQNAAGVVDDFLPSAGVPHGDLFVLITKGPVLLKTAYDNTPWTVDITDGALLYAMTAAASTSTAASQNAGRAIPWGGTFSAAQTTDGTAGNILANSFGRAMSAKTTAQTNANLLANVNFVRGK